MSYDVIVLGAGVNGLTVAASLGKAGKRVGRLAELIHAGRGLASRRIDHQCQLPGG